MKGSLGGVSGKEYVCHTDNVRDTGSIPSLGRSPGGGHMATHLSILLPAESHGRRSLAGWSP